MKSWSIWVDEWLVFAPFFSFSSVAKVHFTVVWLISRNTYNERFMQIGWKLAYQIFQISTN